MIFKGKVAYRIVRTDAVADDMIFIRETQEVHFHIEENNAKVTIGHIQISSEHQRNSNKNSYKNLALHLKQCHCQF